MNREILDSGGCYCSVSTNKKSTRIASIKLSVSQGSSTGYVYLTPDAGVELIKALREAISE